MKVRSRSSRRDRRRVANQPDPMWVQIWGGARLGAGNRIGPAHATRIETMQAAVGIRIRCSPGLSGEVGQAHLRQRLDVRL